MMRRIIWLALLAVLLVVFLPVAVKQLTKTEPRRLTGVALEDVRYQEVTFPNPDAGLKLAGMLFSPETTAPVPGAVIIHGSGTSRRANRWYLTLAQYLQAHGIAVLLPDKRGSEQSEGDWRSASFEELAGDTVAAVSFLRKQQIVPVSGVGVIGLSQGGHIAPIAARKLGDLAFVVDVVGSSLPMHELFLYEEMHNLRQIGFLPGVSDLLARVSTLYWRKIGQPTFWKAVGDADPLPYWQTLEAPALVLYGANDTNVPAARSAARLNALNKRNIRVAVFEGSGHALEDPVGTGESVFREDALRQIAEFIHAAASAN